MRLALISTPRSGNTWLRALLAGLYDLQQFAVHDPASVDWANLPARSIVQVHWPRTDVLANTLAANDIRVVTIARHPLDVLISILHFSRREPQTRHWLLGEGDGELDIRGRSPGDTRFQSYAVGTRAGDLLAVTPQWWNEPGVVRARYESLVTSTEDALRSFERAMGSAVVDVRAVVDSQTLAALRPTSRNDHFWQGRPGLWQSLLTKEQAEAISQAHPGVFDTLGYSIERAALPGKASAAEAWRKIETR